MYRKKKMEERKRKLPPEDGSKTSQSCRKNSNLGMIWSTLQKEKKAKEHDIPDEVVQKQHDIPDDVEKDNVNNVREKLHPHKYVKYMEDCSS